MRASLCSNERFRPHLAALGFACSSMRSSQAEVYGVELVLFCRINMNSMGNRLSVAPRVNEIATTRRRVYAACSEPTEPAVPIWHDERSGCYLG